MIEWSLVNPAPLGPTPDSAEPPLVPPCAGMREHWALAQRLIHPSLRTQPPEPALVRVTERLLQNLATIRQLRRAVLDELAELVQEWAEITEDWLAQAAPHIRDVYTQGGREPPAQIPLLCFLLRRMQYPGVEELSADLHHGFVLLGQMHAGSGWKRRLDTKYRDPMPYEQFFEDNKRHVFEKLRNHKVDPHWKIMLDELADEHAKGRVDGAYGSPSCWPVQCVSVPQYKQLSTLLQAPEHHCPTAVCFSVEQPDKVRRCVSACDVPHHHTVDEYCRVMHLMHASGQSPQLWAHDLSAAYRQFPVRYPNDTFTLLFTPAGPTWWRHKALVFGSTGSVWSFNRAADAMNWAAQQLLLVASLHYVDDFGGVDPQSCSDSGCDSFEQFFRILGLRMKPSKVQRPASTQHILGVTFEITEQGIWVKPHADRVIRIKNAIHQCLVDGRLLPGEASKLGGRMTFLNTTLFGKMGTAALRPVHVRAHALGGKPREDEFMLTHSLRTALQTLLHVLDHAPPRFIPFGAATSRVAILYADAFFRKGDQLFSSANEAWCFRKAPDFCNGWGFVARIENQTFYAMGEVPQHVVAAFGHRRAFIYFLELYAQMVMVGTLADVLPQYWVSFIDNRAGCCALEKGWGSDEQVNSLLTMFWHTAATKQWFPHFEWVPSRCNISDPLSRQDDSLANELGWTRLHPHLELFHQHLLLMKDDLQYASSRANAILLDSFRGPVQSGGCSPGGDAKSIHSDASTWGSTNQEACKK